jgi:hypothetical protein
LLLFAWRKGVSPLVVLWETLIVWKFFFWCAHRTTSPPRAYFIPSKFVQQFRSPLFYGILCESPLGAK